MTIPQSLSLVTYSSQHFAGVKKLWEECFPDDPPWNAADEAIPAKLAIQPELLIVAVDQGIVVGSVMPGYDGHRGWLYALAVLNSYRRRKVGTLLVEEAEKRLRALGCTKINLQVRTSNQAVAGFYKRLGYDVEERVSMGKRPPS